MIPHKSRRCATSPFQLFLQIAHVDLKLAKMKKTVLIFLAMACSFAAWSQAIIPPVDKSPMDISYFPHNYPVLKIQDKITEPLLARVVYSRPKKEGRNIFGGLVEYGKVWRLGANEATEIEFFKQVRVNGKKIPKGRYTVYAIPREKSWTMIINKETDTWGHFKYDARKDVVRLDVPVQPATEMTEYMGMAFERTTSGFNLIMTWDNIKVALPVSH